MFSYRVHKSPRYFEWKSHPERSVIVAGVGRSGTTWLGDVVSHMINARVVFEPCITDNNGNFLIDRTGEIKLDKRYERPLFLWNIVNFEKKKLAIKHMLFGNIKGNWLDQNVRAGIYSRRVIKVIRANLFVGHIARSWPEVKILYIVRSPDKVVESMLNQENNGWKFDWDSDDILSLSESCTEWADLIDTFDWNREDIIDRLALRWCVEMKVALKQLQNVENCMVLQYESLVLGEGWDELKLFIKDRGRLKSPPKRVVQQSSKTGSVRANKVFLTSLQTARIHQMVEAFELSRWIV